MHNNIQSDHSTIIIYNNQYILFFFQRENEIGGGSSLIYPPEVVSAIWKLYPGDIKDYTPKSGKVREINSPKLNSE